MVAILRHLAVAEFPNLDRPICRDQPSRLEVGGRQLPLADVGFSPPLLHGEVRARWKSCRERPLPNRQDGPPKHPPANRNPVLNRISLCGRRQRGFPKLDNYIGPPPHQAGTGADVVSYRDHRPKSHPTVRLGRRRKWRTRDLGYSAITQCSRPAGPQYLIQASPWGENPEIREIGLSKYGPRATQDHPHICATGRPDFAKLGARSRSHCSGILPISRGR